MTDFETFWKAWPHKTNKASAEKAFKKLRNDDKEKATTRAASWCAKWKQENPQASHIHASTYLNQRRFLDLDEQQQARDADLNDALSQQLGWLREGRFKPEWLSGQMKQRLAASPLVTDEERRTWGI